MTNGPDFTDPNNIANGSINYNADNIPIYIEHRKGGNTVITDLLYDGVGKRVKKQSWKGQPKDSFYFGTWHIAFIIKAGSLGVVGATLIDDCNERFLMRIEERA